jgi:hypothetical protein
MPSPGARRFKLMGYGCGLAFRDAWRNGAGGGSASSAKSGSQLAQIGTNSMVCGQENDDVKRYYSRIRRNEAAASRVRRALGAPPAKSLSN